MKFIVLLLLVGEPLYFPLDTTLGCHEQGREIMKSIATYHGPGTNQGWYTKKGVLVYGFYCK
tara:strand:+ start:311 stop:496 length:186 start_codon:yes stop_codon:yes gene_type:complete